MENSILKSLLISSHTTIKDAMITLSETAEKILFVVDHSNVVLGTITDGDIRRNIIKGIQLTEPVNKIMRTEFLSINENNPELHQTAINIMRINKIGMLPVLNNQGVMIDMISWLEYIDNKQKNREISILQNPVVIMAGGKGTRLQPFTNIFPKPLIPFGNKTIIEHIMDQFYKNGFYKFYLIVNYKKDMLKLYLNENSYPYKIEFIEESDYLGTAGGLFLLKNRIHNNFILTNCDTILDGHFDDFIKWHKERMNILTIIGVYKEIVVPYGVLKMSNNAFYKIDEKPKIDLFINTGTYILSPSILDHLEKNEQIDMDRLINKLKSESNNKVDVYPFWGKWFDFGQWDEYRKSLKHINGDYHDV